MSWKEEVGEIAQRRARALKLGGEERVKRQHDARAPDRIVSGWMHCWIRVSFVEFGALVGEGNAENFLPAGYVGGLGRIDGQGHHGRGRGFHRARRFREGRAKPRTACCWS
jgi:acetyl-CoA carboxylase carboxyltransferase component